MPKKPSLIYQIKVTLYDTHPPIWRRILVPEDTNLLKLHDILQTVMGWEDYHLHYFLIEGQYYGNPDDDEYGDFGTIDEKRMKLREVVPGEGSRFKYEYDFGDSWEHTLLVEKVLPPEEGVRYPLCIKGKRACPPEDVGGVWGYENFLEAIHNPDHEEHDEYLEWIGGEFDPESFELEEVNQRLRSMGRGRSAERDSAWEAGEDILAQNKLPLDSPWVQTIPSDQFTVAEALALRRDTLTLLTYLRDQRPAGTQSTGNLPLKAVREIASRFVHPPRLDDQVGDRIYPVRSETEVWPLYLIHVLVSVGGLAVGGPGWRWTITPFGEQFLEASPPIQVWHLFSTWWTKINWEIASPFEFGGEPYTSRFARLVLDSLLDLSPGELILFEPYADKLIDRAGLTWPALDQSYARRGLRNIIQATVINPQTDFGVLEAEHTPARSGSPDYRELRAFKVTESGRGLLEAMDRETIRCSGLLALFLCLFPLPPVANLEFEHLLEVMQVLDHRLNTVRRLCALLPKLAIECSQNKVIISDRLRSVLLEKGGQQAFDFILVGDEQVAVWAVPAGIVDANRVVRIHVNHQRNFPLTCLPTALRAARKAQIIVRIQEKVVLRR